VLFDLGGALVRIEDPPEVHRRILESYGVKVSCGDAAKAHSENEKGFDAAEMAEMGSVFWVKWNIKLLERLGIEENKEFLAKKIDELWWDYARLEVYPDVMETLIHLKNRGIKLGIVTNGLQKDYRQILGKLALADYFDVVVGVDTCAKAKPDKEVFLYAINKLGVTSDEALFVGD
jgi:HAD superfamily hydrolase (TIGR01549 family)